MPELLARGPADCARAAGVDPRWGIGVGFAFAAGFALGSAALFGKVPAILISASMRMMVSRMSLWSMYYQLGLL